MADLGALVLFRGPLRKSSFTDQATEFQVFSKDMGANVVVYERRNSST